MLLYLFRKGTNPRRVMIYLSVKRPRCSALRTRLREQGAPLGRVPYQRLRQTGRPAIEAAYTNYTLGSWLDGVGSYASKRQ